MKPIKPTLLLLGFLGLAASACPGTYSVYAHTMTAPTTSLYTMASMSAGHELTFGVTRTVTIGGPSGSANTLDSINPFVEYIVRWEGAPGETPPGASVNCKLATKYFAKIRAWGGGYPFADPSGGTWYAKSELKTNNFSDAVVAGYRTDVISGQDAAYVKGQYYTLDTGYFTHVPGTVNTWEAKTVFQFECILGMTVTKQTSYGPLFPDAMSASGNCRNMAKIIEIGGQVVAPDY